ncbi:hypothetical protein [Lysinibacillus irui]|uniref:hypothetical protein n=1 Tax=Lysinibacillus irui TaxID=2998077 RepID=UPI002AD363D0|nr:hypothetical protein [Lysinibacillus irui]MEA0565049.1 hypothetical protein [Lysinibacillus irui]
MNVFSNILEIPSDTGYWLVRADGGKYYDDFFLNNFIAISDNEITLELINQCKKKSIVGITLDHYKNLYRETYKWKPQQIALAAGRTQKFLEEIKIGDIVLVPARHSSNFLIGVVTSDYYEITESEIASKIEVKYAINPYLKRRDISWIKEVSRNEISDKLYWMLSAHQTIFNLKGYKDYINQLLAPVYIHDGFCHGILKVSKAEGLDSDEWFDFYSLIKHKTEHTKEKVFVKSNVQSPGILEMVADLKDVTTIVGLMTVLGGAIFTEVKIGDKSIRGILPYFLNLKLEQEKMKQENKQIEVGNSKSMKEVEILEEERRAKQLENELKEIVIEGERMKIQQQKLEMEAQQVRNRLQISSFDAGRVFEDQTQMDSGEDLNADES